MTVTLAICLLYVACFGLFHAHPARTSFAAVKESPQVQTGVKTVAWVLLAATLFLTAQIQGWERGIPIWLGLATCAGVASLLIAALLPKWHAVSAAACTGASFTAGIIMLGKAL